MAILGI